MYMYIYVHLYLLIYIYREREREREHSSQIESNVCVCMYVYIYIYIYIFHSKVKTNFCLGVYWKEGMAEKIVVWRREEMRNRYRKTIFLLSWDFLSQFLFSTCWCPKETRYCVGVVYLKLCSETSTVSFTSTLAGSIRLLRRSILVLLLREL